MKIRNEFANDLQVEKMELRELHFMLNKILEKKTFLNKISKFLHEIIDEMWNSSEDQFVKMGSQVSISKKEYISRFIYNVRYIDQLIIKNKDIVENKKNYETKIYAGISNYKGSIKLVLLEESFNSEKMLKTLLSHEIGHLMDNRLTQYINLYANSSEYVKGNLILATMWSEGLAEDTANNNTKSKFPFTSNNVFKFVFHDDKKTYYLRVPQNGYTNVYQPISTIYAEFKTILSVNFLEEKIPVYTHLTEEFINAITEEIKNRDLAEKYIIQSITTYEQLEYYKEVVEKTHKIEEEQELRATYLKNRTKKVDEWNKKILRKRNEDKEIEFSFETNFIRLQKMFFEIMGEKVRKAKNVEEVYEYTNAVKQIKMYLPILFDSEGKCVTDQIIGINEFKQKCSNKISELQEQGKTSNIPYNLDTDSDEVEL